MGLVQKQVINVIKKQKNYFFKLKILKNTSSALFCDVAVVSFDTRAVTCGIFLYFFNNEK